MMKLLPGTQKRTILWGLCLMACLAFCTYAIRAIPRLTHGFAAYYTSARIILEGEPLSKAYDLGYFAVKIREYGMDLEDMPNNLPTNALAAIPVAWMSARDARIVWSLLSLAALGLALNLLFRIYGIAWKSASGLALLTVVLLWWPTYENVAYGQIYFFLLLLLVLCTKGLLLERPYLTAVMLALTLVLKGYGIVPLLLFAAKKEWTIVGYVTLCMMLIVVTTLPILGIESWHMFAVTVLPSLGQSPPAGHVAYQTINSLVRHLFTFDSQWLPLPLVALPPALTTVLSSLVNMAALLYLIFPLPFADQRERLLSFGAAVAAGVVTAPLAEEYHFVLFLPLLVGLAARFAASLGTDEARKTYHLIGAASLLVLGAPLHYKVFQSAPFPTFLLGYPKLYAGVTILWYTRKVLHDKGRGSSTGMGGHKSDMPEGIGRRDAP